MFSAEKKREILEAYEVFCKRAPKKAKELATVLAGLSETERLAMQFTYAFMPMSDVVSEPTPLILQFVQSALQTRELVPWGKEIPEDLFLNFVLFYRINNENMEFYKDIFFAELFPRVKDKTIHEAALEVNYWCFEKATYRAADSRTLSPLGTLKGALARCGEESVLTVAAMRSVGIPARQCYVPRWAHCDDNHAWVEVWVDGKWQYLGACEPEAVLNKGWFTAAASKAMLVHAKSFADKVEGEIVTAKTPIFCTINNIQTYGASKEILVEVKERGKPLPNMTVRFELVNYSELFPLCTLKTDANGQVRFLTGLGDLHIHVTDGLRHMGQKIDVRSQNALIFAFEEAKEFYTDIMEFDMQPPKEDVSGLEEITNEKKAAHDSRFAHCNQIREAYEATFFTKETAEAACKAFGAHSTFFAEVLVFAKGNRAELMTFLQDERFSMEDKQQLLSTLREKDYTDTPAAVLADYLLTGLLHKGKSEEKLYVEAVLAPRVGNEMLLGDRSEIAKYLADNHVSLQHPKAVWEYLTSHIALMDEFDYPTLIASGMGLLQYQQGSKSGLDVLFVNICRTLGMPARLNSATGAKEFYENGEFVEIGEQQVERTTATLQILNKSGRNLTYFTEISVARLEKGVYQTLSFWDTIIGEEFSIPVKSGHFRILMSARQIDGSVLARAYHVTVAEHETKVVSVEERKEMLAKKLRYAALPDTELQGLSGQKTTFYKETAKPYAVAAFVEVGKEPTEHLFNEICDLAEEYNKRDMDILVLLGEPADAENKTLQRTLAKVPSIKLFCVADKEYLPGLHKIMGVGDERKPFALALDSKHRGLFAFSNYNVGTAATLLKIIQAAEDAGE